MPSVGGSVVEQLSTFVSTCLEITKLAINLVSRDNIGSYLSLIGLVFLGIFSVCIVKLINQNPDRSRPWQKWAAATLGVVALTFIAGGPAYSLLRFGVEQKNIANDMSQRLDALYSSNFKTDDILQRLQENKHVKVVIRLIPYDPERETELSASRIASASLGNAHQRYTFVSDYEELKGYTAATAARMSGLRFREGQKVTAVIFPLRNPRQLIPVNARGLLQLAERVETDPQSPVFKFKEKLSAAARSNLRETERERSWAWDAYREFYTQFCHAAYEYVCSSLPLSTDSLLGRITHDWHPLGFARSEDNLDDPCKREVLQEQNCSFNNASLGSLTKLGPITRVFMTENSDVRNIDGRIVIDFDEPIRQRIPAVFFE